MVQLDERLVSGDHDLMAMLVTTQKAAYIDEVLNYIRRHEGNISAPGTITDLIGNLEYNRTLEKLRAKNLISKTNIRRPKPRITARPGGSSKKRRYKRSNVYLLEALKNYFRWYYLKIFIKSVALSVMS